jgi:hypothetical protein
LRCSLPLFRVTRWGEQSRNSGEMTNGERKVKRAGICVCSRKRHLQGRTAVAGSRCRYRVVVVMEPSAGERDSRQRATVALAQLTAAPECSLASALLLRPLAPAWIATATGGWHSRQAKPQQCYSSSCTQIDLSARHACLHYVAASCRARGAAPSSMAAWHACVICISARACSRSIHSRARPGRIMGLDTRR